MGISHCANASCGDLVARWFIGIGLAGLLMGIIPAAGLSIVIGDCHCSFVCNTCWVISALLLVTMYGYGVC